MKVRINIQILTVAFLTGLLALVLALVFHSLDAIIASSAMVLVSFWGFWEDYKMWRRLHRIQRRPP